MPDLTARFSLVDQMSDSLDSIAQSGLSIVEQFERAGDAASAAIDGISGGSVAAASAVDGVAVSITGLKGAADGVSSSADILADSINAYGDAAGDAAAKTDYWTDAVGNYDESVLEAIYSTEELVEMGFKSADALEEQERMLELCEQSANELGTAMESASEGQEELASAMEAAAEVTEELSKNEEVSAETKEALARASTEAAEAMNELQAAQEEAAVAMEAYDAVISSGTTDLETLESAAERAGHAAEALAQANDRASGATEELSKATEQAAEEAENSGKKGVDAVEGIASALAAAGITATVKEIAEGVYELVDAFSEAESIVVKATGASGAALDGLMESTKNAYAAAKSADLSSTASAVGEINTRMGLTGETLTTVTGQFLDFSNITGTNVVGSVQNATKIMNKWNVEGSNVGSVLDKLAYAGQVSGISVDGLSSTLINSSATFQALDMNLDNTIGLLADLELYGTSSQTVVTGLRTAVNNFSKDGLDAGQALRDVINEIANMEDASEATALAVETFGSRAGQELAGAIRSGAISVDSLTQSLDVASGTLTSTADTAQTLNEKWTQASNNIGVAFTSVLEPALSGVSSGLAGVVNGVGNFLNAHPGVVKAITVIGVGLGTAAVAIAGVSAALGIYTAATTIATAITGAFGATFAAAFLPITAIVAGVAALATAVYFLVDAFGSAEDETANMTSVTREQYYELQNLNAEYEAACEKYGETSEEASLLRYELQELTAAYESSAQTIEEFCAECDAVVEKHRQMFDEMENNADALKTNELNNMALIAKLEQLAGQTDQTAASEQQMQAIIDALNGSIDGLNLSLDDLKGGQEGVISSVKAYAQAQADARRQEAMVEEYIALLEQQAIEEQQLAAATDEVAASQERATAAGKEYTEHLALVSTGNPYGAIGAQFSQQAKAYDAASEALEAAKGAEEELSAALDETNARIAEIESSWEAAEQAAMEAAESPTTYQEAVAIAYDSVKAEIEELCAAYDEAYQAALESFEGQFGLFDQAQADMDATVANAQAALDSQLAYWDSYAANLEVLKNTSAESLGITQENYDALMSMVQDGSEEAAGLAASMAEAIASGDADAVADLANTVGEVSAKQQEIAEMTADWQTGFSEQMDAIEQEMQQTVADLNMSDEASQAASETISAYADSIRAGKDAAVSAAQEVASAVTAALQSANANISVTVSSSGSVKGHARGTTNAESVFLAGELGPELIARPAAAYATGTTDSDDYFIAGENGPELIVGEQGSTVFPTQETDRLIAALNERRQPLQVFADAGETSTTAPGGDGGAGQERHIYFHMDGSGTIEITGGANKEAMLEVLTENLKPVLMSIMQGEIYEEGDQSYDF